MFLTGFADEASRDLKEQIRATEELGWKFIETRFIGNKNLGTISDAEFEDVLEILSQTDVRFNCYGSNIANWGKSPRSDADFEASRKELLTAIPRMHKLGIKMVRGMSFKRATEETFDNPDLEKVIFAKIRKLVRICESEGIIYGHENCMNYGGQSWHHTLRLLDNIKDSANNWLAGLVGSEYLLGARVEILDSENPMTDLMAGIVRIHIYMTPPSPAQEIDFVLEYNTDYVQSALA